MNWKHVSLGEISVNIQTGPFGSQLHQSDYSEKGTPVVMPKDLISGHISEESIARVSDDHVERLSRHKIEVGDILYSRRGDVGRCAFASETEAGWLCGTGCLRVTIDSRKANPKFVFYQLLKADTIGCVEKHAVGSTMLNLNTSILSSVPIDLPSHDKQNHIVGVLSAYDDLIENNQKQIKLLEEAAQRLYKEWFVDLRFPGHETTPIVDGVPAGWERMLLSEVTSVLKRGISPKYSDNGKYSVINQKCIRSSIMDISESRRQEKEYEPTLNLQDSDTVICSTGTGTLGRVGRVYGDYPNTTFDSHVTLVRAKENPNYIYHVVKSQQEYLMGMGRGSTNQQELYRDVIERLVVLCPSQDILLKADRVLNAILSPRLFVAENKEIIQLFIAFAIFRIVFISYFPYIPLAFRLYSASVAGEERVTTRPSLERILLHPLSNIRKLAHQYKQSLFGKDGFVGNQR